MQLNATLGKYKTTLLYPSQTKPVK